MLKLIKFLGITSLIIGAFLDSVKNGFMAAGIILLLDYMIAFASSIEDDDDAQNRNAQYIGLSGSLHAKHKPFGETKKK